MKEIIVKKLIENPEIAKQAAFWFSKKWDIPEKEYYKSILECIDKKDSIPQWYVVMNRDEIIAGAGVIENDFHDRKDLKPNLCALYVEKEYRDQGIARYIINFIRRDLGNIGIKKLYLVTDHKEFYEKCGWQYLTMVNDNQGLPERMYVAKTL